LKTKYQVIVGDKTFTGNIDELLRAGLPRNAEVALSQMAIGVHAVFEHLGSGKENFLITILSDHRIEDFFRSFGEFRHCCRVKLGQEILHAMSVASHNDMGSLTASRFVVFNTFLNHLIQ